MQGAFVSKSDIEMFIAKLFCLLFVVVLNDCLRVDIWDLKLLDCLLGLLSGWQVDIVLLYGIELLS